MSSIRNEAELVRLHAAAPLTAALTHFTRGSEAGVTIAAHLALALRPTQCVPLSTHASEIGLHTIPWWQDLRTPHKPGADVGFVGKAHPLQPVQTISTRVGVFGPLGSVDRSLRVVGDRPHTTTPPALFSAMPMTWERTWSGRDRSNPVGIPNQDNRPVNVFDPQAADEPASFAPIPESFPARARLLGPRDQSIVEAMYAPVAKSLELGDEFRFEFFYWASPQQRLPGLSGTEEIVLENLIHSAPQFHSALPALQVAAHVRGGFAGPRGEQLSLQLDGLLIDGDACVVHAFFRMPWFIPRGVSLMGLQVEVALGHSGHSPTFVDRSGPVVAAGSTAQLPELGHPASGAQARVQLGPLSAEEDRTLSAAEAAALADAVGSLDTEPPPPEAMPPGLRGEQASPAVQPGVNRSPAGTVVLDLNNMPGAPKTR